MPNIAAHMIVAKEVSERLKINDNDFIRGNLLPDVINISNSHNKIKGKYFLIPDIEYFKKNLNPTSSLDLGYLTHLLLDKYYLEEFIPQYVGDLTVFERKVIYHEYDLVNYDLVKRFNLDVDNLEIILSEMKDNINKDKLKLNIDNLKRREVGDTTYLKVDEFSTFLSNISIRISKEIEEYASKYSNSRIYTR